MDEPSDSRLAVMAREGDTQAFATLVRRHQALAIRTAALIVGVDEAEDAAQEALVKAYVALPRFQPDRNFRPWLLTIVRNEARSRVRQDVRFARLRRRVTALAPPEPEGSSEEAVIAHQRRLATVRALARLPENLRLTVTCRYLLELTEAETADALGCPIGTVKSRTARALERLRGELSPASEGVIRWPETTR